MNRYSTRKEGLKIGDWIVGRIVGRAGSPDQLEDGWTYPGRVVCIVDDTVVFEVIDYKDERYEIHRKIFHVRQAYKSDFDRVILDANNLILKIEMFIDEVYGLQKEML